MMEAFLNALCSEITLGISALIAAVIAGLPGKMFDWIKTYLEDANKRRLNRDAKPLLNGLKSYALVGMYLKELVAETKAARACLVMLHNGGDVPKIGKKLKATILSEESLSYETSRIMQDWQSRDVDNAYITDIVTPMLNAQGGLAHVDVKKMTKASLLKDHYDAQGVKVVKVALLGFDTKEKATFLLSVQFDNQIKDSSIRRDAIRKAAYTIASTLNLGTPHLKD